MVHAPIPEIPAPVQLGEFFLEERRFPAVYFLCFQGLVVYVGQTRTLKFRIDQHIADGRKVFDAVAFVRCTTDRLLAIEGHYIRKLAPKYNACALAKAVRTKSPWKTRAYLDDGLTAGEAAEFLGVSEERFASWQAERIGPRQTVRRIGRERSRLFCGYDRAVLRKFSQEHPDLIAAAQAA